MSFKSLTLAAAAVVTLATPALAEMSIMIHDAYARSGGKMAKSGAAFMQIMNHSDSDDRLIAVTSDEAQRVELHTHMEMGDGIMKMMEVEEGFAIPAHGMIQLARGGDHVMFMGLVEGWEHGDVLAVTLTFENAGDIQIDIPVDLERKDAMAHGHGDAAEDSHGGHAHH